MVLNKHLSSTALFISARFDHREITRLLLKRGANVHLETNARIGSLTALSIAASLGHIHIARLLLDRGANLEHEDRRYGTMPLSLAMLKDQSRMARFLLDRGANVNHVSPRPRSCMAYKSPLLLAADDNYIEMAELLLDRGANVEQKNHVGYSPLLVAVCRGSSFYCNEMVRLLLGRGADIDVWDDSGEWTPLIRASYEGDYEMVQLLLTHGAKHNLQNNIGQTALDSALSSTVSKDVVYLLVQAAAQSGNITHIDKMEAWRKSGYGPASNSTVTETSIRMDRKRKCTIQ